MRAKLLYMVLLLLGMSFSAIAQQRTISGTVTDEKGETVPGISVLIKGTTQGTTTDADGKYNISANDGATLVFQGIGYVTQEMAVTASNTIDVQLKTDQKMLGEVVVTGTADGMAKEKVPFGIATIDQKLIQQVPGVDAGQALQGKIAGVTVVQGAGPSGAPSIRFRGATQLTANNAPLVLVDGVITDGSIGDINAEDIYKIEAVKGASGASLYGSRAGNGVLQIITRKGQGLKSGETKVTFRNEFGSSSVIKDYPLATKNASLFNAEGRITGPAPDGLVDNDFPKYTNQQRKFFTPGNFMTNYLAVEGKTDKTGFLVSFQNMNRSGVIKVNDGYQRRNFRVNLDHQLSKKISMSLSSAYINSDDDFVQNGQNGPFFALTFMPPNADLEAVNPFDGSPYRWDAARVAQAGALEINPLYRMANNKIRDELNRVIGGTEVRYDATDWLTFSAVYGIDSENFRRRNTFPVGYLPNSPSGTIGGRLTETATARFSQNFWLNAITKKKFGDLNTTFRLSFLREKSDYRLIEARAQGFPSPGLINLGAGDPAQSALSSVVEERVAHNIFAAGSLDYKDRYILDFLVRQDKSSLFGANSRSKVFYRVSGAYRISQDFAIEAINEWKIRTSYGTSGQRPSTFDAQYETYTISGGALLKQNLGNTNLRPSVSAELEIGTDIQFLKRYSATFNYARTVTDDQILLVPLTTLQGLGFQNQWQNAGELTGNVIEAALNATILETKDIQWSAGLVFSRIRQKVTRLDIPAQRFGPGNNSDASSPPFFLREGENLGIMYGQRYARTPDDMQYVLASNGQPVDANLYTQNSDGLMVLASAVGTSAEAPVRMTNPEDRSLFWKIGDSNPNFNLALNSTFTWKGLSVFFLFDWKSGGDVYNLSKQWAIRELRHNFVDGGKHSAYYGSVSNLSSVPTDYFIEKGSYIKLRELNVSYRFSQENLMKMGEWAKVFREIRVGVVGRNLFMITKYSGVDPEVSSDPPAAPGAANNFDRTLFGFDAFGYPQFRTVSGFVTFSF
ncbi:MAG: SusC/RagA family TonB-linked outer membrane protein [Bacteroidetes bacterium]|nr:MAG: SusC/RagA family TonB-linked outer membrane protein [Bacteroidota bacterium]